MIIALLQNPSPAGGWMWLALAGVAAFLVVFALFMRGRTPGCPHCDGDRVTEYGCCKRRAPEGRVVDDIYYGGGFDCCACGGLGRLIDPALQPKV